MYLTEFLKWFFAENELQNGEVYNGEEGSWGKAILCS